MPRPLVDRARRRRELRALAAGIVQHAGISAPPVPLEALTAGAPDLKVWSLDLGGEADGLLRWSGKHQRFHLFYHPDKNRWRFNLAHELAHYCIEEHCRAIRSRGFEHRSRAGFRSDRVAACESTESALVTT